MDRDEKIGFWKWLIIFISEGFISFIKRKDWIRTFFIAMIYSLFAMAVLWFLGLLHNYLLVILVVFVPYLILTLGWILYDMYKEK